MKFFNAKREYRYLTRKCWVGQYIDSREYGVPVHVTEGLDTELTSGDVMADDWEEYNGKLL